MKHAFYLILCLASLGIAIGQKQARHKKQSIVLSKETLAFALDIHGNVYVIDSKLHLIKRNAEGDTLRIISVLNQGSQPILDVSNPLEIFIYFASTGRVAWYDNQLNPGGTLDVFATGTNNIGGFGRANDGNIWLFDNNKGILKRINREGEILEESLMLQGQGTENSKIFDNGKEILVRTSEGLQVLSNNLILLRTLRGNRSTFGWNREQILSCDSQCIYQSKGALGMSEDTLYCGVDGKKIVGGNHNYLGAADESGIILQLYKKN